jgi:hypothetical protein
MLQKQEKTTWNETMVYTSVGWFYQSGTETRRLSIRFLGLITMVLKNQNNWFCEPLVHYTGWFFEVFDITGTHGSLILKPKSFNIL